MSKALYPKKSKIKHYKFIGFDTETYSKKNKHFLTGVFDETGYHCFRKKSEAIRYLSRFQKGYIITATNLQFDFTTLYLSNLDEFLKYSIIMRNGGFILCKNQQQTFIDTLNINQSSVKELGKMLKIGKLNTPKCLGRLPKNKKEYIALKRYNSRDCEISKSFMEYFQEAINELGGEFKMTIASGSMDLFQRKYLKFPIYHEPKNVNKFIFESYFGGRVEATGRGNIKEYLKQNNKEELYYYDFNSLYPSVMRGEYPLPSSMKILKKFNDIEYFIRKYKGITKCRVKTPKYMKYPILPHKDEDGKLCFPLGEFSGTWTNDEISLALDNGYKILRTYKSIYYEKTFYPFKEFVEDLYKKRNYYKKTGNEIMSLTTKLIMNSLYGKFGTKKFEEIKFFIEGKTRKKHYNYLDEEIYVIKGNRILRKKDNLLVYTLEEKECKSAYVFPIFASYTTAYGRIKLWKAINKYNPVYYDTDSLITLEQIEDSQELGHLKLEEIILDGIIVKPKIYLINQKIKFKGMRFYNGKKKMEFVNKLKIFNDMLKGKKIKQRKFLKMKESLRRGLTVNEIIIFDKFTDLEDTKRKWRGKFNRYRFQLSNPLIINDKSNKRKRKHPEITDEEIEKRRLTRKQEDYLIKKGIIQKSFRPKFSKTY